MSICERLSDLEEYFIYSEYVTYTPRNGNERPGVVVDIEFESDELIYHVCHQSLAPGDPIFEDVWVTKESISNDDSKQFWCPVCTASGSYLHFERHVKQEHGDTYYNTHDKPLMKKFEAIINYDKDENRY